MPPFLCEEMQEYIKMLYDIKPDERLFTVTKSYLNHEMERGAKQAGVKKIRVHDIRHPYVKPTTKNNSSVIIEFFTDSPSSVFAIRTRKVLLAL